MMCGSVKLSKRKFEDWVTANRYNVEYKTVGEYYCM